MAELQAQIKTFWGPGAKFSNEATVEKKIYISHVPIII